MAAKRTTKLAALNCRYPLRRGKHDGAEKGSEEPAGEELADSRGRGKKRRSIEIKDEVVDEISDVQHGKKPAAVLLPQDDSGAEMGAEEPAREELADSRGRGKKRRSIEIKDEVVDEISDVQHGKKPAAVLVPQDDSVNNKKKPNKVKIEAGHVKKEDDLVEEANFKIKTEPDDGESKWFPSNWETILDNIRRMRKDVPAPVDSMGCDMCHDKAESPKQQRYQILVSLMLSSQTKDSVTFAAMGRLREHGLSPEKMIAIDSKVLEELLKPVGFYKRKTGYIKRASQILLDKYNGDIPNSVDALCELPGVGPKMAHICMNSAWNVVSGIGVDTHVHRISERLGWLPPAAAAKKKRTPEDTRAALESWLPVPLWSEVNHLLVGFGQTICKPVGPSCKSCLNETICPYNKKGKW